MPVDTATPDKQTVNGPDGKKYTFSKGISQERIDKYFAKKGIKKPSDPYGMGTSKFLTGKETADTAKGKSEVSNEKSIDKAKSNTVKAIDYGSKALPTVMGQGYSMTMGSKKNIAGAAMAALGGMAGASANEIIQRFMFGRSGQGVPTGAAGDTNYNTVKSILIEGVKQGGLELAGRKMGDVFFNLLNKIPHAALDHGIKFLPSELNGGRVTKYIEDLLTNLIPSQKVMAEFKSKQNAAILGQVEKLAKGFSRFRGTTEEMGNLLQDTYRTFGTAASKQLRAQEAAIVKAGGKPMADSVYRQMYSEFNKNFQSKLAIEILKTNKPETIGAFLRTSALQETRNMVSLLEKEAPKVINATRTRLMQDILQETLTGVKDPIQKQFQKQEATFAGNKFKETLDKFGEDKLKAIYGDVRFKNIQEFSKLVNKVGSGGGNGAGKFLNLLFLLGPIRSGFTLASGKKIAVEGFIFNRAAKIITSTDGIRLMENYIRATGIGSVKAISLARDELKVYSEHQDEEYKQEQEQVEEKYYKDNPDELKYKNINKPQTQEK